MALTLLMEGPFFVDRVSFLVIRQHAVDQVLAFDRDFEHEGFALATVPADKQRGVHEAPVPYGSSVESGEFVSVYEISERAGRPVNTVQSWRRRHGDFPPPVAQLAAGPIWKWSAVEGWIAARGNKRARAFQSEASP